MRSHIVESHANIVASPIKAPGSDRDNRGTHCMGDTGPARVREPILYARHCLRAVQLRKQITALTLSASRNEITFVFVLGLNKSYHIHRNQDAEKIALVLRQTGR